MSRHLTRSILTTTFLLSGITQGCVVDTASTSSLTCEEEGAVQNNRICQNGFWFEMLDMTSSPDLDTPDFEMPDLDTLPDLSPDQDMDMTPEPDLSQDMDMGLDLGPDMDMDTCPDSPDPQTWCQNQCDTSITIPENDPCFAGQTVLCDPSLICGNARTCVQGECVDCPTNSEQVCEILSQQQTDTFCGTFDTNTIPGCTLAGDLDTTCTCEDNQVCDTSTHTCQACVPKDQDTLVMEHNIPQESCNAFTLDDGCGSTTTTQPLSTCLPIETCDVNTDLSQIEGQAVSTCKTSPPSDLPAPTHSPSSLAKFGATLAIHNDMLAVGAPNDDVVNSSNYTISCGAVYIYTHDTQTKTWTNAARVVVDDSGICNYSNEDFGHSIELNDRYMIVGAPGDGGGGRVFLFEDTSQNQDGSQWTLLHTFDGEADYSVDYDGRFGHSITSSFDTNTFHIVVGAPTDKGPGNDHDEGAIHIFSIPLNAQGQLDLSSISHSVNSHTNQYDARLGHNVMCTDKSASTFTLYATAPSYDVQADNSYLYNIGRVFRSEGSADPVETYAPDTLGAPGIDAQQWANFAESLATSTSWIAMGTPRYDFPGDDDAGIVVVQDRASLSSFVTVTPSQGSDAYDAFGTSVAVQNDYLLVGAPGKNIQNNDVGAAYLFRQNNNTWTELASWNEPGNSVNAHSGSAVALHPDWVIFSAPDKDQGKVFIVPITP